MQPAAAGDAILQLDVEFDRALGAVGRESCGSRARGVGPHTSLGDATQQAARQILQRHLAADFGGIEV